MIAALPLTPVIFEGAPGVALLTENVFVIVEPLQLESTTVIVPEVKAVEYLTFTELPFLTVLSAIVEELDTDHK